MILGLESLRLGPKIGRKLVLGGFGDGGIFSEKLHLLSHTAANDDVIAVEAGGAALAVEHFVANVVVDEALQFLFARRALPGTGESLRKAGDPGGRNNDPFGRLSLLAADQMKQTKQRRAEHEKLE